MKGQCINHLKGFAQLTAFYGQKDFRSITVYNGSPFTVEPSSMGIEQAYKRLTSDLPVSLQHPVT